MIASVIAPASSEYPQCSLVTKTACRTGRIRWTECRKRLGRDADDVYQLVSALGILIEELQQ